MTEATTVRADLVGRAAGRAAAGVPRGARTTSASTVGSLAADRSLVLERARTAPTRGFARARRATIPAFVAAMVELCAEHGVDLVVPTIDPELPVLRGGRATSFAAAGTTVAVSAPDVVAIAADKVATHEWLHGPRLPDRAPGARSRRAADPELAVPARGQAAVRQRRASASPSSTTRPSSTSPPAAGDVVVEDGRRRRRVHDRLPRRPHRARCVCAVPRRRIEVRAGEVGQGGDGPFAGARDAGRRGVRRPCPAPFGAITLQVFVDDETGATAIIELNARFGGGFPLSRARGRRLPTVAARGARRPAVDGRPPTGGATAWSCCATTPPCSSRSRPGDGDRRSCSTSTTPCTWNADYVRSGFDGGGSAGAASASACPTSPIGPGRRSSSREPGARSSTTSWPPTRCRSTPQLVGELVEHYRTHEPAISTCWPTPAPSSTGSPPTRPVAVAVVTDGPLASQRAKARALDLDRWADPVLVTDELGPDWVKPSPLAFALVEERAEAWRARHCAYVADNPAKDFAGPKQRGWKTVGSGVQLSGSHAESSSDRESGRHREMSAARRCHRGLAVLRRFSTAMTGHAAGCSPDDRRLEPVVPAAAAVARGEPRRAVRRTASALTAHGWLGSRPMVSGISRCGRRPGAGAWPRTSKPPRSCGGFCAGSGSTCCTPTTRSPGSYGRVVGRLAGVPVVVNTNHGFYFADGAGRAEGAWCSCLEGVAALFSDAELVQNEEDLAVLRRWHLNRRRRTRLLGNGVDLSRFRPAADRLNERPRGGSSASERTRSSSAWSAGWWPRRATPSCSRRPPSLGDRYVIGRDRSGRPGQGRRPAPGRRSTPPRAAGVRFLGLRDDVDRLYRGMDLFVLPSHREGFPRAAMEAAASGLAVVATDVRGCRQVVEDGVTGLLVPVRAPARLAAAIAKLGDRPRRRGPGPWPCQLPAHFDERRVVEHVSTPTRSLGSVQDRARHVSECRWPERKRTRQALHVVRASSATG